ncbi:hypothetical protein BOX15_Mlig011242g2 [Macrostomum lignano]|uniref:Eukaryotic translation initiation factor 4E-binding protein 1 n=1 Tax=Macrostomum lignano TaxID=282301 RepID=A0A267DQA5_9PLAT|nr:hypothetical protein BOX15_Mlig011242g2 [Macrostomum lignano]
MSVAGQANGIPVRRVRLTSTSQMPRDYSQTPGGTIFSTTPGGTRIIYDRDFLISRRDSPLAKTPPANLPRIPGVTCPEEEKENNNNKKNSDKPTTQKQPETAGSTEFEMDI